VKGWAWAPLLVTLSFLPDADVVAFRLRIPYAAPFGHRGAMHSLVFAAVVAAILWGIAAWLKLPAVRVSLVAGVVVATHGILDAFTDGGLGIALLWPFTDQRYFAAWRPIPVAPIGARILSPDGLGLMLREALLFLPLWIVAAWPSRAAED
jgi:inner membrane protein